MDGPPLDGRVIIGGMSSYVPDPKGLVVNCPSCNQKNRIAFDTIGAEHRCPQCKAAIPAPASAIDVPSAELFDALVSSASVPVVVDYWAPWCGPCRSVAPELEKVAQHNAGSLLVVKVNTDAVPELANRYHIQSIPTMAVFAGGQERARSSGARPARAIEAFVHEAVVPA
jgi:thioredoxin 2